jgi:hypothetical protein
MRGGEKIGFWFLGENCLKDINGLMKEKLERFYFLWSISLCCRT